MRKTDKQAYSAKFRKLAYLWFTSWIFTACFFSSGQAQNWVDLSPVTGPVPDPRGYASAVFDTGRNQMVIFGGRDGVGDFNDVWAFSLDTNTWTELTPLAGAAPAVRRTPGSVYDAVGQRMVTWSGQAPGVFFNDVWEFDLVSSTWSEFTPSGGPPNVRYGVAVTYDPIAGELVTFAGFTNLGRFDDVWRFDPLADTWSDVSPGMGPIERCLHSASYDSYNHRMIMYGGQNAGPLDDIWAFDLATNTWSDLTPATRPPGRFFAAHVYDVSNHRSTVFGGTTGSSATNEVWVFDFSNDAWTQLTPTGIPPSAREGAAAIYQQGSDRMIVFGGKGSVDNNDVWALENLSNTVTSVRPAQPGLAGGLSQNVPNPFNPTTTIEYSIPERTHVNLSIYNVSGKLVRALVEGELPPGSNSVRWDGRDSAGREVTSGVYFYRLETPAFSQAKKMVLLR